MVTGSFYLEITDMYFQGIGMEAETEEGISDGRCEEEYDEYWDEESISNHKVGKQKGKTPRNN